MKVKVNMLAFTDGKIRIVDIPDNFGQDFLGTVFHHGQNEVQSQEIPSVSMGDVIEHDGKFWLVAGIGFRPLTTQEFVEHQKKDKIQRILDSFA